jgi:hypothetical protein
LDKKTSWFAKSKEWIEHEEMVNYERGNSDIANENKKNANYLFETLSYHDKVPNSAKRRSWLSSVH